LVDTYLKYIGPTQAIKIVNAIKKINRMRAVINKAGYVVVI